MVVRLMLLLTAIVGVGVAAYGLFVDKSGQAIAFATAGLFVLGVSLAIAGFITGMSAISHGRAGRGGRATLLALIGGVLMIAAAGALAGAVVFAAVVLL